MTASSSSALFELRNVRKRFGNVVALNGASIKLRPGEVRALIGGNGSGKSTMAKVLTGIVAPDHVEVFVGGAPATSTDALSGVGIRATFQDVSLLDDLSVEENLLLGRLPRRARVLSAPRAGRALTGAALDQVLLPTSLLPRKVRELSLDQRTLAELAKVLLSEPKVVIMDELTASLRSEQVDQIGRLIKALISRDVAVLFVSHRLEEVEQFCTSCTVLRNGSTALETDDIKDYSIAEYVGAMTATNGASGAPRTPRVSGRALGETILDVRGLTLEGVVSGVDLQVREGEILGLGGLAGNGQSEILRAIYGSLPSRYQRFQVDGEVVGRVEARASMRRGIGFLSGDREREMAFGQRTVDENLAAVARSLRKAFSSSTLMERMKIVGRPDQPMRELSGGNQQKVIIGRWLDMRPRILLADDPTRGVDVGTREEIHRLLRELTDERSAVVLTSSDDRELAAVCDRVCIMYRGRIVAELAGDEVTEEEIARVSIHPKFQEREIPA